MPPKDANLRAGVVDLCKRKISILQAAPNY